MSKEFAALLRIEWKKIRWAFLPVPFIAAYLFYLAVPSPATAGRADGSSSDPGWYLLVGFAVALSFAQLSGERREAMWAFVVHRRASRGQIFAAKVAAAVPALMASITIGGAATIWWAMAPGHSAVPIDRTLWLIGAGDSLSVLTFYAAGLYIFGPGDRKAPRILLGITALVGAFAIDAAPGFPLAAACSLALTALVGAAAYANFASGGDFESQPTWGRAANVTSGSLGIAAGLLLTSALASWFVPLEPKGAAARAQTWPLARVTSDGRIERLPASASFADQSDGVIVSDALAATGNKTADELPEWYRDPRQWVMPLFAEIEGPAWYYERRAGLISIRDRTSGELRGWLGPDGYTEGAAKPTTRFSGMIQTEGMHDGRHAGLLVLERAVYKLDELSRPELLFTAPPNERILRAAAGRLSRGTPAGGDAPQDWFNVFVTNRGTYVAGRSGVIQVAVPHAAEDEGRRVRVYRATRAPDAPTLVWYRPATSLGSDTLNHVLEYRAGGTSPVAEFRFAATPDAGAVDGGPARRTMSLSGTFGLIPALQVMALATRMTLAEPAGGTGSTRWSALACLGLAAFVFLLCRRSGFTPSRTGTWTALTAMVGPLALALMWAYLEWPARQPAHVRAR